MRRITAKTIALLLVTGCSGGAELASTTSGSISTTSTSSTSTTLVGTTTPETTSTTTRQPPTTLAPIVAQAVFAFTDATSQQIRVTVEIGESPEGPWQAAGSSVDPAPVVSGSSYWLRFTVENTDELGTVMDVEISDFDDVIGQDVCELSEPIPARSSGTCVVGGDSGIPVNPNGDLQFFESVAAAVRQGTEEGRYFRPVLPTILDYEGYRHSFLFAFDTEEGVRIDGNAEGNEIVVSTPALRLSRPIRVDCSDPFTDGRSAVGGSPTPSDPRLAGYVIANFNSSGENQGGCSHIPLIDLDFNTTGDSDDGYHYETSPPET